MFDQFRPQLLRFARRALGGRVRGKLDADDVVQETLAVAYARRAQFRGTGEAEFAGWLRRILGSQLARTVRHYCGTLRRDAAREQPGSVAPDPAAPHTTPSQAAVRSEVVDRVGTALNQLSDDYRRVLEWRERQGLSFAEIARLSGRSENAVRKIWIRALLALRGRLATS